eukprot:TRINITY_DN105815_c0_g1_i1.p1 TRINITY_DN105815_c0_g1~~TRINITY_DN105815_c0_g1_i1.p1  ORF type:complete len:659 (-),score=121.26 TRINITY_DN105815_c0_g1_i1:2-1936(-)
MASDDGPENPASPAAAGGAAGGKGGLGISLNSLLDSATLCPAVLDAPLANPLFMSDAPNFLHRQRVRAAKALVSEHAGTITCSCLKCQEAARGRAHPAVSSAWPLPPLCKAGAFQGDLQISMGGSLSSTAQAAPPGSANSSRRPASSKRFPRGEAGGTSSGVPSPTAQMPGQFLSQPRDFIWLLRVISETCPAYIPEPGQPAPVAGVHNYDGTYTFDPGSVQGKLGVTIPETVWLEKGKPKKRYFVNKAGRLEVQRLKTSAELLRVLRNFAEKAMKPRELVQRRLSRSTSKGLKHSKSSSSLPEAGSRHMSRSGSTKTVATTAGNGTGYSAQLEIANLYYHDGMSRLMMLLEATIQMDGASKLPREFWQHIRMLQVPVQSKAVGTPSRFIIYNYDINNDGIEPQEPMPLGGGARMQLLPRSADAASRGSEKDRSTASEAARLGAVPKRLNEHLSSKSRTQGLELVSGTFEFVLDEADGTLWLINAYNLICRALPPKEEEDSGARGTEEMFKFFEEDEFWEELQDTESSMSGLKKRFGGDPGVAHGGVGVAGITVSAADQLAGVKEAPQILSKFYEEEEKMLHYYHDEVRVAAYANFRPKVEGPRAVGLGCWFRRWVRGVKGRSAIRPRQRPGGTSVVRHELSKA